jgi:capsular exopolysaccharide synthesis family protein
VVELEKSTQKALQQMNERLDAIRTGFKNDYESALNNQKLLQKQVDEFTEYTTGRQDSYLQYEKLKTDLGANSALYQDLKQQLQEAGITASLNATHVSIINPPTIPYMYKSPKFRTVIPGLLILCIITGIIGAFLADQLDDSLSLPEQAEEEAEIPIMGIVPHFESAQMVTVEAGVKPPIDIDISVMMSKPDSPAAEAYRTIRTAIQLLSSTTPKVIVVTSPLPNEGKSTTSLNLATAMAQKGRRVLLIDGDMRRPTLHHRFAVPVLNGGLSAVLTEGYSALQSALIPVGKTKFLTLLPAGAQPPIPGDLLESQDARELIGRLRDQFDNIIIDAPPVLAVNDPLILGRYADVVLVVVRAHKTPKSALRYAAKRLREEGSPVKGIVFTDINPQSREYYYSAYSHVYGERYYSAE